MHGALITAGAGGLYYTRTALSREKRRVMGYYMA